jgi:hypothetical protein
MPKPIILDPDRPKKRKRKKRKVDYSAYLVPPVVPDNQCIHTTKPLDASQCSQCLVIAPTVVKRPPPINWWSESDDLIEDISIEDFDNSHFVSLVDDDDE